MKMFRLKFGLLFLSFHIIIIYFDNYVGSKRQFIYKIVIHFFFKYLLIGKSIGFLCFKVIPTFNIILYKYFFSLIKCYNLQ